MNYFIFIKNGVSYDSRDYGIGCGGFPPIVIPQKRINIETIEGRNGSLISTDDCYDSYTKSIECYKEDDVYADLSWLNGSGKLILSNELERQYDVTIKNNIELSQIATYYRNFYINFEVQPFKTSVNETNLTFTETDFEFNVGGNTKSYPIMLITGTGDIDITVNDSTFKIMDLESTILIDSQLQIAQENNQNALPKMNGEFPVLIPNTNTVHIVGNLTSIEIKYRNTYL